MSRLIKVIITIFIAGAMGAAGYMYRDQITDTWNRFLSFYFPCQRPIYYSLGTFDTRFGLPSNNFLRSIREAEALWEKPVAKDLFAYSQTGNLKINLIYDYRQEATATLQKLGYTIKEDRTSYDALKIKYDSLFGEYQKDKARLDDLVASFRERQKVYDAEVADWNKRGQISKETYERLTNERLALEQEFSQIKILQDALNAKVAEINALVVVLNRLVNMLNLNVTQFNEIGAKRGEEFVEGNYYSGPTGQRIDIYQFDDRTKLVTVLAHELGHALGLEHINNPQAIMYRLNRGANAKLTADDLTELKRHCGIK